MGIHTIDPVSGEFSLGAAGILYSNGRQVHPVRGVTIAGNILDLWNKIIYVGDDLRFYGRIGSPSLLIDKVTIGGT
jgi:PmbA protein